MISWILALAQLISWV